VTILDGATLAPGTSTGTLTVSNLVLNSTSVLAYELGTTSDQTVVTGNLTLDGTINITDAGGLANGHYTLFTYTTVTDNALDVGTMPGSFSGSISNDTGGKRILLVVTGGGAPPVANFSATPLSGVVPLQVVFTDLSTETPTSWAWDFDNDGSTDSTAPNPTNTYSAGTYSVKLIACNGDGCSTNLQTNYITAFTAQESWESAYGVGANGTDTDGDGATNLDEFLAGFNPTNSAALLRILNIARSGNDIRITFLGSNGDTSYAGGPSSRTNVLEFTTGTGNGGFTNNFMTTGLTNILSGGTGQGTNITVTETGGATNGPARYYRVTIHLGGQ
jgi:PKD repeat protein